MALKSIRNPHLVTLSFTDEEYDQLEQVLLELAQKAIAVKKMPMRRATFLRTLILEAVHHQEIIEQILAERGKEQN